MDWRASHSFLGVGKLARRYRLTRFPLGIVYVNPDDDIIVFAVMHLRRRPGYWRERLKDV